MSVQKTLQNQAAVIDEVGYDLITEIDLTTPISGRSAVPAFLSDEQAEISREQSRNMKLQNQFEFSDYDPELDKGLITGIGMSQQDNRAENQTWFDQLKIGASHFAIEAGVGALQATSLLLDLDMHKRAFKGEEEKFTNEFSEFFKNVKEDWSKRAGTVYRREDDPGFDPGSWSFWMQNAGSVASVVSTAIPAMGAIKAASWALRGSQALRALRLSTDAKGKIKGISSAIVSRLMENAMVASETVEDYTKTLTGKVNPETGVEFTEAEIGKLAGKAGRQVWVSNWPMLFMDAYQYTKLFKGIDYARKHATNVAKQSMARKIMENVGGFVIKDMGSQGFEEGYQFVMNKEAQHRVSKKAGLDVNDSFLSRMGDYIHDDEFKTSVFMGAVGGGIFSGIGALSSASEQRRQTKERARLRDIYNKNHAAIIGNAEAFEKAEAHELVNVAFEKAQIGDIDQLEADLNDLYYEADESLKAQGIDPKEYRKKIDKARDTVKNVAKEYNRSMNMDIPDELKIPHAMARIDQRLGQDHLARINEAKEKLLQSDKEHFGNKEEKTAEQMVQLKRKVLNKQAEAANKLAQEIADSSDYYKSAAEVMDALSTQSDPFYTELDDHVKEIEDHIKEAQEFEKDIKTREGQEKRLAQVQEAKEKAAAARRKAEEDLLEAEENEAKENAKKAAKAAGKEVAEDDPEEIDVDAKGNLKTKNLTPEVKTYLEERNKVAQEKGIHDTGLREADGVKVFSTGENKGKGAHKRTWIRGETVKDATGQEWVVDKPIKHNRGVFLFQPGKPNSGKDIWAIEKEFGPISHESRKPGRNDWTVNKFIFDPILKRDKADKVSESVHKQIKGGVIKTGGQEFANWKPMPKGPNDKATDSPRFAFDGKPKESEKSWFKIDYEAASEPMEPGVPQDVEIVLDTTQEKDCILVKQGDKIISQIFPTGRDQQFENLLEYLSRVKDNKIKAQIIDKEVTFRGNFGNIPGTKTSLRDLKGSKFLFRGKVFIGSRKPTDKEIKFYAEDGDTHTVQITEKMYEATKGAGNTFMLMLSPDGSPVPIMLNEATMAEVKGQSGKSMAEETMEALEAKAAAFEAEFRERVQAYREGKTKSGEEIEPIASVTLAIAQVKKEMGFAFNSDRETGMKSPVVQALEDIIAPVTRLVGEAPKRDEEGNYVKTKKKGKEVNLLETTKNYFNVRFEFNGTNLNDLKIGVSVTDAVPQTDPNIIRPFDKQKAKTREQAIEKLGKRFMATSLDKMADKKTGKDYIKQVIDQQWVTTDVYVKRPWVNTRLVIKLDDAGTKATAAGVKAPAKSFATKQKEAKKKKAKSEKDVLKGETADEIRASTIVAATKRVRDIIDIMSQEKADARRETGGEIYSLDQFMEDFMDPFIEKEALMEAYVEAFERIGNAKPNAAPDTVSKLAMMEVVESVLTDADDSIFMQETEIEDDVAPENELDRAVKEVDDHFDKLFGPQEKLYSQSTKAKQEQAKSTNPPIVPPPKEPVVEATKKVSSKEEADQKREDAFKAIVEKYDALGKGAKDETADQDFTSAEISTSLLQKRYGFSFGKAIDMKKEIDAVNIEYAVDMMELRTSGKKTGNTQATPAAPAHNPADQIKKDLKTIEAQIKALEAKIAGNTDEQINKLYAVKRNAKSQAQKDAIQEKIDKLDKPFTKTELRELNAELESLESQLKSGKKRLSQPASDINLVMTPSDDILKELNKLDNVDEKLQWLADGNLITPIIIDGKSYNVIDYNDMIVVMAKIGKYNVPFYINTGQAGKKNVKAGRWDVVFGIGESGWINRGSEAEINKQYDFPVFQKIAKILNGSIERFQTREDNGAMKPGIGFLANNPVATGYFNRQMNLPITPAKDYTDSKTFYDNLNIILAALNKELIALGATESKVPIPPDSQPVQPSKTDNRSLEGKAKSVNAALDNLKAEESSQETKKVTPKRVNFTPIKKEKPIEPASESATVAEKGVRSQPVPNRKSLEDLLKEKGGDVQNMDKNLTLKGLKTARNMGKNGNLKIDC